MNSIKIHDQTPGPVFTFYSEGLGTCTHIRLWETDQNYILKFNGGTPTAMPPKIVAMFNGKIIFELKEKQVACAMFDLQEKFLIIIPK